MTVNDALKLAQTKRSTFDTCFEYPDFYVFSQTGVLDSSFAVNKNTRKVVPFNPMFLSKKELKMRKKIEI